MVIHTFSTVIKIFVLTLLCSTFAFANTPQTPSVADKTKIEKYNEIWKLILTVTIHNGGADIATLEFNSYELCNEAGKVWRKAKEGMNANLFYVCVLGVKDK